MKALRCLCTIGVLAAVCLTSVSAQAAFHLWQIKEIFSSADGTVQFIELETAFSTESFVDDHLLTANSDGVVRSFTLDHNLPSPTTNKHMLFATAGFGGLTGGVTPDFQPLPANFFNPNAASISITFAGGVDVATFAGPLLPKNGVNSLTDTDTDPFSGVDNFVVGVNSPTNFAGTSGSVNVPGQPQNVVVGPNSTQNFQNIRTNGLTLTGPNSIANVTAGGGNNGTSVINSLTIGTASKLNLNDNDLVVHPAAGTKDAVHADLEAKIVSAQNGVDPSFITNWNGPGVTSTAARTANVAAGFDLTALGVIRNSDLNVTTGVPGSAFTTFSGQPVTPDDVLVKYTYTGDGNLDGAVTFDDYAAMDAAFFNLIPNLGWATGDINFDNVINFDDYAVVDQAFFNQGAPLASKGTAAAVGEPCTLLTAIAAPWLITMFARRRARRGVSD